VRAIRAGRGTVRVNGAPPPLRARDEWAEVFRTAPIGVLVIGFLLLVIGLGFLLGGTVYVVSGRGAGWPIWLMLFGAGPLVIYVAVHFVSRQGWAWITIVAMLFLILLSAALRAATASVFPVMPLAEILLCAAAIAYLLRPRVRGAFGR
jgi:hypothetical protein